jgi:hypothetical protein
MWQLALRCLRSRSDRIQASCGDLPSTVSEPELKTI